MDFDVGILGLYTQMLGLAMRLTKDMDQAEDLRHETIDLAYRHRDQFTDGTNLRAWVFKIMRNQHLKAIRNTESRGRYVVPLDEDEFEVAPDLQEQFMSVALKEALVGMEHIPKAQRDALVAVVFDGDTYDEAAARFAVEIGTIKSRLNRARAELKPYQLDSK